MNTPEAAQASRAARLFAETARGSRGQDEPGSSRLPVFYIAPTIGRTRLLEIVAQKSKIHLNCVRAEESAPDKGMIAEAMALRKKENLDEPMFRTLLRVRYSSAGRRPLG